MTVLRREDDGSTLTLDVLDVAVNRTAEVTRHPVEGGSTVSDHSQVGPADVVINAVVSETVGRSGGTSGPDRVAEVLAWFDASWGKLITVALPDRPPLPNMMLTGRPWTQAVERAIRIRVTLVEVRFATSEETELPPAARASGKAKADLASEDDDGQQGTKAPGKSTAKVVKDLLASLFKRSSG